MRSPRIRITAIARTTAVVPVRRQNTLSATTSGQIGLLGPAQDVKRAGDGA